MNVFRKDAVEAASPASPERELPRRRGVRALALAAAATLALASCSGGGGEDEGLGGGTGAGTAVVTANGSEPENPLVPTNTNEVGGGRILDAIFAGLIYYQADGTPQNDVAESIVTEDSQTYTITIRDGLTFSDGSPVTASSFVDAWNHGAAAKNAQLSSYMFEPIQGYDEVSAEGSTLEEMSGLEVVDDTTFRVTLKQPEADFPLRLGYSAYYPLPESAFEDMAAFGENPIGNGPYMFAGEGAWQHDARLDLVPNEAYDGPREAQNGGLSFVFYADNDAAYTDLLAGNLDVLDNVPDSALATFESELGERAVNQPAAVYQGMTVPSNLPHFQGEEGDLRLQAISHAIDRETITEAIFQDTRTPAQDFSSPVISGWTEDVPGNEVLTYDPERAQELWAQADAISPWSGSFDIAYNSDGGHQAWVDAVTNNLRQTLGIESEGRPFATFAQLREEVNNRSIGSAFRGGWQADYPSMYNFLAEQYATGAGANDGDYSNPEFDALIDQAAGTADEDERTAILLQAQSILMEDLPSIPLWYSNVTGGYSEAVADVEFGWNSVPLYEQITKE